MWMQWHLYQHHLTYVCVFVCVCVCVCVCGAHVQSPVGCSPLEFKCNIYIGAVYV